VSQLAFKFLAHGARGPVSGFAWPTPSEGSPGAWVEASGPLAVCESGIHACDADQLAHWLHEELWVVEIAGETLPGVDCTVAARGRLLRQVDAWRGDGDLRFAVAARDHAQLLSQDAPEELRQRLTSYIGDASYHLPRRSIALAAFCSAMTVAWLRGLTHFSDTGYREERAWQSQFIRRDLGL
jgi:hypothetical protein